MSAILHVIVTDIENNRMKEQINYWRWQSNIYYNKKDALFQIYEEDKNMYMCDGDEGDCECGIYSPNEYLPRGSRICENCEYEPDWQDAFSKWGHNDGGSTRYITQDVVDIIESLGYDCCGNEDNEFYDEDYNWRKGWGSHNQQVITKIIKVDTKEVVYPAEGVRIGGYDDRYLDDILPRDIVEAILDIHC